MKKLFFGKSLILFITVFSILIASVALAGSAYKRAVKKWTEKGSVYTFNDFEARLIWEVTYQSLDYRMARVQEEARLNHWTPVQRIKAEQEARQESLKTDKFFASIYAGSGTDKVVGKDPDLWKFLLVLPDGTQVPASSVTEVKKNELHQYYYPYIQKWSKNFIIEFPKTIQPDTKRFSLVLAGVPNGDQLTWKLKK